VTRRCGCNFGKVLEVEFARHLSWLGYQHIQMFDEGKQSLKAMDLVVAISV